MVRAFAVLFVLSFTLISCSEAPQQNVELRRGVQQGSLPALDEHHSFDPALTAQNLTVWPLRTDQPKAMKPVASLWEAEKRGDAIVREQGTGTVSQLVVENRGDLDILICGGTVLKGGKQDRQVGNDVLIAAGETAPLPAFCIEQGRWSGSREGKHTNGVFACTGMLAAKRIRVSAQYASNQSQVWEQVSTVNSKAAKTSASDSFLATIDDTDAEAVALRKQLEAAVRAGFDETDQSIVGFAYAINGEPLTIRTFANAQIFRSQFDAFLRTMCLEAEVAQKKTVASGHEPYLETAKLDGVLAMVKAAEEGRVSIQKGHGAERNRSIVNSSLGYNSFQIENDGRWKTMTSDWTVVAIPSEDSALYDSLGGLGYTGDY